MNKLQEDAMQYQRAQKTLDSLRRYRKLLTRHEVLTLRGLALSGDVDGAEKGLAKILKERRGL